MGRGSGRALADAVHPALRIQRHIVAALTLRQRQTALAQGFGKLRAVGALLPSLPNGGADFLQVLALAAGLLFFRPRRRGQFLFRFPFLVTHPLQAQFFLKSAGDFFAFRTVLKQVDGL